MCETQKITLSRGDGKTLVLPYRADDANLIQILRNIQDGVPMSKEIVVDTPKRV